MCLLLSADGTRSVPATRELQDTKRNRRACPSDHEPPSALRPHWCPSPIEVGGIPFRAEERGTFCLDRATFVDILQPRQDAGAIHRVSREVTTLFSKLGSTVPDPQYVDIHCHILPEIDDGAKTWQETLAMAQMAVADGIRTIIATPHQLGNFTHNGGAQIRQLAATVNTTLAEHQIPLTVLPGADVRIEAEMIPQLRAGNVLTLADRQKHVLLELPHELYFPVEPVLGQLERLGMQGILSHPERNQGLLRSPEITEQLVDHGCLMQVTAGSLMGTFGPASQAMAEWMLDRDLVHFLATDAHGIRSRRPLLQRCYSLVQQKYGADCAERLCVAAPSRVANGAEVELPPRRQPGKRLFGGFFNWRKAS